MYFIKNFSIKETFFLKIAYKNSNKKFSIFIIIYKNECKDMKRYFSFLFHKILENKGLHRIVTKIGDKFTTIR